MSAKAQITPYLGQVATRSHIAGALNTAGGTAFMSRSYHIMQQNVSGVQIAIPNWYVNGASGETGSGNTATVTASIEYPLGTMTQVKFGGSSSGSVVSGATITSDICPVTIPLGAAFWVRIFFNPGAATLPYQNLLVKSISLGDAQVYTGASDQTMSGTVTDTAGSQVSFFPAAIIGITSAPSFLILGDSRTVSGNDTPSDNTALSGMLARTIGRKYALANWGIQSDTVSEVSAAAPLRYALAVYFSHIVCQLGVNDIGNGAFLEVMKSSYLRIHNALPLSSKFIAVTIPGKTTSTDSFATLQNQTPSVNFVEGKGSVINAFNDWIRGQVGGSDANSEGLGLRAPFIDAVIECADVYMATRNSMKWIVTGGANGYTTDGLHPNTAGCQLLDQVLSATGVIDSIAFATSPFYEASRNEKLAGLRDKDGIVTPVIVAKNEPQFTLMSTSVSSVGTSTGSVLSQNPNAKYRCFINNSANTITLSVHSAAVAGTGIVLPPTPSTGAPSMYEMYAAKGNLDTRDINAIASGATSNLVVIECT